MKKMLILSGIALSVAILGCNKVKNLADINVDLPYSTQVNVPAVDGQLPGTPIPGGAILDFPTVGVETKSKQYLAEYHTDGNNIRKLDLKSLSIQMLMPPNQNFNFLDTIQVYIGAGALPEVLVAYKYNIPQNTNTVEFITVTDVNLKDYFLADTIRLHMRARINAAPASATQLNIASVFHMLANPLY